MEELKLVVASKFEINFVTKNINLKYTIYFMKRMLNPIEVRNTFDSKKKVLLVLKM